MPPHSKDRLPRWYAIPVRVLLMTFIGTLIIFAVSLLAGILGTVILAMRRGAPPNMTIAYRHVALPAALVAGVILLVLSATMEIRHYRQSRALAGIARAS
jgi:hypothetical protein